MKMLEKGKVGSMELKNRVFFGPVGAFLDQYGPHARAFAEARLKGGAGLIFTKYLAFAAAPEFCTPESLHEPIKQMADLIHQYGAKGCIQLDSGLGRPQRYLIPALENVPMPTYAASAVPEFMYEDKLCVELTREQILANIEDMRKAARFIAKESGYDAIEIQAYGGYLPDCFLTKRWNKRTDEYGGEDLRSRAKYLLDIIAGVREEVGPDYPIFVKFTPSHFMDEEGYRDLDEGVELAKLLEEAGVDLLHVDAGCFENWELSFPPSYQQEETWSVKAAAAVKAAVNIPVAVSGKLGYPERGEAALQQEKCDFICVARGMLADPEFVNKIAAGATDDIRPCMGCNEGCIHRLARGDGMLSCAVNPEAGYENFHYLPKAETPKKILVIGAGPAGITAALDAKNAGHEVEIWEKRPQIGGLLTAAARPSFKKELRDLIAYYRLQLAKSGATIRYNKEATAEDILAYDADEVILAVGSKPLVPGKIPGVHGKNVVTAVDAMNDTVSLGGHLVMIGSGLVGCETAMHLSSFGKQIDIVEMAETMLPGHDPMACKNMVKKIIDRDANITVHTGTKLIRIEEDGVIVEKDGQQCKMLCDTVVLAMGLVAAPTPFEEIRDKVSVRDLGMNPLVLQATAHAREALQEIAGITADVYTRAMDKPGVPRTA